jgi:hypothetical protein
MAGWLGVVQAEHVARALALGEPLPGGPPSVAPTASAGRVAAAPPPAALW